MQFEKTCEILAKNHPDWHFVTFDQVGHGGSFSSDISYQWSDFEFDSLYSNAEFIVNHFRNKYQQKDHKIELCIAAHSVGSGLAMRYCINHRDIVSKLILLGTKPEAPGKSPVWVFPSLFLELIRGVFSASFAKLAYHESTPIEVKEAESEHTKNNTMYMMKAICTQLIWPTQEEIATIKVKTLVISGETDGLTQPERGKVVHELIENSQFCIIEGASHNMMIEKPSILAEKIEQFFIANEQ